MPGGSQVGRRRLLISRGPPAIGQGCRGDFLIVNGSDLRGGDLNAVFVFAAALLLAVLIPERASRGVLSTAVLFLVTGFVMSQGMFGVVVLSPQDPAVAVLAELALFSVLFTDGMRTGAKELSSAWRLPGRALLLGLPLTL